MTRLEKIKQAAELIAFAVPGVEGPLAKPIGEYAEEIIELVGQLEKDVGGCCSRCRDWIEREGAGMNKWIKSGERLPEPNETVLGWDGDAVFCASVDRDDCWWDDEADRVHPSPITQQRPAP